MRFTASFSDCSNITITPRIVGGAVTPEDTNSSLFLPIRVDDSGSVSITLKPTSNTSFLPSYYNSNSYETSCSIKNTPGIVYLLGGYVSASTNNKYIQLHDSSSLPIAGDTPKFILKVTGDSNFIYSFANYGLKFDSGIYAFISSTPDSLVVTGSNLCWFNIQYI